MLEILERAEKIYARIKGDNYSMIFYWHYQAELNYLLDNLTKGIYND